MDKNSKKNNTESFPKVGINWYPGHMAKAKRLIQENLDKIDVIYEVIDSRMPYSSKIKDIDTFIKDKKKILIMSKMDLCDKKETLKWVKYYENKGYKVLLMDLEHNPDLKSILNLTSQLMQEENEKRNLKGMIERKTRVLVVGIPNCGKSTLINRLAGKNVTNVGNKPGVTKDLSWIRLNDKIELLDSPGILWPKLSENNVAFNLASLSAIKEEILPIFDVIEYILKTLEKYYPNILKERYGIENIEEDFVLTLDAIGKRRGCLIKGGEIDYEKVYTLVMNDVKNGIIKNITFDRFEE